MQFEEGWLGADDQFYGSADEAWRSFAQRAKKAARSRAKEQSKAGPGSPQITIARSRFRDIVVVRGDANLVAEAGKPSYATLPATFDVVISYAGADLEMAEKLAILLHRAGIAVFFDRFYRTALWGKDLPEVLDDLYRNRSRFCIMLVSAHYAERVWTTHEKRSALARDVRSRDVEYILPIMLDDTELRGLRPSVSYLSLKDMTIEEIAEAVLQKLRTNSGA